ncbi:hypothetical protein BH09PAT4_BH09PAT4_09110 [soil metagenome]
MGIDAAWITDNGESKQKIFDLRQCLTQLAMDRWHKLDHTKCLQFIDPWGDALFNQGQIPVLLRELHAELPKVGQPEVRAHLEKVIRLVERTVDQTHTYVKFIGD